MNFLFLALVNAVVARPDRFATLAMLRVIATPVLQATPNIAFTSAYVHSCGGEAGEFAALVIPAAEEKRSKSLFDRHTMEYIRILQ